MNANLNDRRLFLNRPYAYAAELQTRNKADRQREIKTASFFASQSGLCRAVPLMPKLNVFERYYELSLHILE